MGNCSTERIAAPAWFFPLQEVLRDLLDPPQLIPRACELLAADPAIARCSVWLEDDWPNGVADSKDRPGSIHALSPAAATGRYPLLSASGEFGALLCEPARPDSLGALNRWLESAALGLAASLERWRLRAALQDCEAKYRNLFELESEAIFVIDNETGNILDVNHAAETLYGYSRAELLQRKNTDLSAEPNQTRAATLGGRIIQIPIRYHRKKNGVVFPVEICAGHFLYKGRPAHIAAIRDISERIARENELRRNQQALEIAARIDKAFLTADGDALFSSVTEILQGALESPHGFFGYIDDRGDLACPSLAALQRESVSGAIPSAVFKRADWGGPWSHSLREKRSFLTNEPLPPLEGLPPIHCALTAPILHQGELAGLLSVANKAGGYTAEDQLVLEKAAAHIAPALRARLAERRHEEESAHLENQLRQSQKMEAIGVLAGGIAHDFNNILSAVLGYAELAMQDSPADSSARRFIGEVISAGRRAQDLTSQILAFSRQTERQMRPLRLQPIVKETCRMLRGTIPSTIEIQPDIDPECGPILGDASQIHQLLMNFCTNAFHAMRDLAETPSQHGRPCLMQVRLRQIEMSAEEAARHIGLQEGQYAVLSVRDTGHGMDAETMRRIFEPYFTTKPKGVGTGLGLAVAHSIIQAHGGAILASSEPDQGSEFRAFFPILASPPASEPTAVPSSASLCGAEAILFVDDEEPLLQLAKDALERFGYRVEAHDGAEAALAEFRRNPDAYQIVVTDLTMPKMTGMELAQRLWALRPRLPIVLCTGFSERITREKALAAGFCDFALKPIVAHELAQRIRKALDRR